MLLTIEKVIILKTVSIFSEMPEEYLVNIATLLEEVEVKEGAKIIDQGEMGSSMYIIVEGKVRIHQEEKTLAILEERNVFGEWAALDPELRAASATALEPVRLFRLEHESLYDLMAVDIEVVRGIVHFLCQRLRSFLQQKPS